MKQTARIISIIANLVALAMLTAGAARADWTPRDGLFRIGIVGTANQAARYEPFRQAVEGALNTPARLVMLPEATKLIDAQASGEVNYAVLSSLGYAAGQVMCACLVPLVAPTSAQGARGVRSVLVADAGFQAALASAQAPEGLVGLGPQGSLTGDLIPRLAFDLDGVNLAASPLTTTDLSSFEEGRVRFLAGDLAAFFAWNYVSDAADQSPEIGLAPQLIEQAGRPVDIVWSSEPVPFGPHAVHQSVPQQVRDALVALLVDLERDAPDAYDAMSPSLSGGFVAVSAQDYAFAQTLVERLAAAR